MHSVGVDNTSSPGSSVRSCRRAVGPTTWLSVGDAPMPRCDWDGIGDGICGVMMVCGYTCATEGGVGSTGAQVHPKAGTPCDQGRGGQPCCAVHHGAKVHHTVGFRAPLRLRVMLGNTKECLLLNVGA